MIHTIEKFIEKKQLLSSKTKVIVGLSGGMDSMMLLDVLTMLNYRCIAAHCNFHLRGEESDRDAKFVKQWCKSTDVELISIDFDTREYAADKKISIEMAARELRYRWFEMVRVQHDAEAIAVAHHKDDSVETVLLNLVRGTGIAGLTGISAKNGNVIRPLLCISRAEIEKYISERGIPHVFDSTNSDDVFVRNFLRLTIIPKLEELNPSVKEAVFRTANNVSEAEKMYSLAIEEAKEKVFFENKISIDAIKKTASPQSVLFELLSPMGFSPTVIDDILNSLDANSGKVFYANEYRIIKDRDFLLIDAVPSELHELFAYFIDKETTQITQPIHLNISLQSVSDSIIIETGKLYADADKLLFPLTLRKWQPGDWFIPFGMKGRKKLSDYFTDRKFSLKDKEDAWILASGDDIVWIVGERSDNRFRITEKTRTVFIAEFTANK